jgi:hypothetical protein
MKIDYGKKCEAKASDSCTGCHPDLKEMGTPKDTKCIKCREVKAKTTKEGK